MGFYLSQEKCFISTCSRQEPSGEMASAWVGGLECQGCVLVCAHVCVCVSMFFVKASLHSFLHLSLHHVRCLNCSQLAPHETTASRFGECSFLSVGGGHPLRACDGLWQPQFSVCLCTYRIPAVLPGAWQGCDVGLQRLVDVVAYINSKNLSA